MAFFRKVYKKINRKWYPQSITVGEPINTDQVADRLAAISTVSRSDTYAVLKDLGGVLADFMAQGRTVKLAGVGTFYYTSIFNGRGMASADRVKARHIKGVYVRFIPETAHTAGGQIAIRSLMDANIVWEEWVGEESGDDDDDDVTVREALVVTVPVS